MKNNTNRIKGELFLFLAAVLWGSCFIFQKKGMDYIGPFTLGAFRFILGGLVLLPLTAVFSKRKKPDTYPTAKKGMHDPLWKGGILCGSALFLASSLQQIGLVYTTAGKAAFLTSMEIAAVEIIGFIFVRKLHLHKVLGIALAISGMYFLCISRGLSMQPGDVLELIGALFWGMQILLVDKYAGIFDGIRLSFIEFLTAGSLSAVCMFLFEKPNAADIRACAIPILYTAIVEVAICYTLQIIGQKYVPPVIAAVTLSMESVFAVIFGAILLREALAGRELIGMLLMLTAVIVMQIPDFRAASGKRKNLMQISRED